MYGSSNTFLSHLTMWSGEFFKCLLINTYRLEQIISLFDFAQ